jgi:hypothetical protein
MKAGARALVAAVVCLARNCHVSNKNKSSIRHIFVESIRCMIGHAFKLIKGTPPGVTCTAVT